MSDVTVFINSIDEEEVRVAVTEGGRLRELFLSYPGDTLKNGQIFLARVSKVVPTVNGVFVNLGDGRDGFISLSEFSNQPCEGQPLLAQVTKEARKNKGPRLTTQLSFAGEYLIFMPSGEGRLVSRKLSSFQREELRQRLHQLSVPYGSLIARTSALGVDVEFLQADCDRLVDQWRKLEERQRYATAPARLWQDGGLVEQVLRDQLREQPSCFYYDNPQDLPLLTQWIDEHGYNTDLSFHKAHAGLFEYHHLEGEIERMWLPKVRLPSGGDLVIEQTEALTAIDVNSGKHSGASSLDQFIQQVNLEAAREIAWQLRLRAIGGIVVIDFIDMKSKSHCEQVMQCLRDAVAADREKTHLFPMSPLGLVELSRRRSRPDFRSLTRQGTSTNEGGTVLRSCTQIGAIKRLIRKTISATRVEALLVVTGLTAGEQIAREYLAKWERQFNCRILLRAMKRYDGGGCRVELTGSLAAVAERSALNWKEEDPSVLFQTQGLVESNV